MSDYIHSQLALGGQLDFLSLAGFSIVALFLFGLLRQYYLHFAVPPAYKVREWYPIPDDLPTGRVPPYGATAIRKSYRPNLMAGVNGSVATHLTIIVAAFFIVQAMQHPVVVPQWPVSPPDTFLISPPPPLRQSEGVTALPDAYRSELPPPPMSQIPIPVTDSPTNLHSTIIGIDETDLAIDQDYIGPYDIFSKNHGPTGPGPAGPFSGIGPPDVMPLNLVQRLPELITIPQPDYPEMARIAGVEGTVRLELLVGADGRVHDVRILTSVQGLDDAATAAARGAVFRPALWQNKPVAVRVMVPMRFSLSEQ